MENEEFQDGIIELATLNNILLQITLFRQKAMFDDIFPSKESVIKFVNGLIVDYNAEDKTTILSYIDRIESFSDKAIDNIITNAIASVDMKKITKDVKSDKPKIIKFC